MVNLFILTLSKDLLLKNERDNILYLLHNFIKLLPEKLPTFFKYVKLNNQL